jgi:hypothetical protein
MLIRSNQKYSPRSGSGMVEHMKEKLGLTDLQTDSFKKLLEQHRDSMKIQEELIRKSKLNFYMLVKQDALIDSVLESANLELAKQRGQMDMIMFKHFQKVRALCNLEQKAKYDSMLINLMNRTSHNSRSRSNNK